jgi:protein-tyrosine-phosphatase/alkylated DNA nucleotide flippase Atl1
MARSHGGRRARTQVADGGSRVVRILARVREIPAGFVRTYGDIDPGAPRMVGRVLATTHEDLPWHRVVRADGSIPKGTRQRSLLLEEGVPMRGERVDLKRARLSFWDEKTVAEVLFVCVHNAGRSQMAAGLLARHGGDKVNVRSAGSAPASEINPAAVQVMNELGVDMSQEFPKPLTDEFVNAADVVITMGCGDACPIYPGKRYEDWEVEDPAGKSVDEVRAIRDDLDGRVKRLFAELAATAPKT